MDHITLHLIFTILSVILVLGAGTASILVLPWSVFKNTHKAEVIQLKNDRPPISLNKAS